jgi:hypothetical protein
LLVSQALLLFGLLPLNPLLTLLYKSSLFLFPCPQLLLFLALKILLFSKPFFLFFLDQFFALLGFLQLFLLHLLLEEGSLLFELHPLLL